MTIDEICEFFGYESYQNYLRGNKAFEKCMDIILSLPDLDLDESFICSSSSNIMNLKQLKIDVRNKFMELFYGVDLDVYSMDFDVYEFYEQQGIAVLEDALKTKVDYQDIFHVQLGYDHESHVDFLYNKLLMHAPIVVSGIYLNYTNQEFLEDNYIHELGHVLVGRKRGGIREFLHSEFIPILLELLYLYENNDQEILKASIINKLKENYVSILLASPTNHKLDYNSHLVSGILSLEALEKYIEFSNDHKKEMLDRLKNCLNNYITVESFMSDYDIGFQSVEKSSKYLNKIMDRLKS